MKVNAVVKRGVNDDGIVALAERFRGRDIPLRFIEYMDVGQTNGWRLDDVVPADEIVRLIGAVWPLDAVATPPGETALRHRYRDGAGEIGVIASVTKPFCGGCSRARLSAEGRLYTCLFALQGHDLREPMRAGAADEQLANDIQRIWSARADRYSLSRATGGTGLPRVEMSYIGG